ncbi:MAG: UDP-N-acetylmuramoyl-L-alanine--D-glutamate ligase [Firmicutes bacterium]|nr:UDP-N-acetylmuramoyl-L-alanine--D-glutamate ligase [Bacillota bacterium]
MNLKDKNIVVLGLAVSGVSTAKAINRLGANITITDMKKKEELVEDIKKLEGIKVNYVLGSNDVDVDSIDLIIKNPGVPLNIPLLNSAREKGIEIITDIELASRLSNNPMIAITGTNGKTTTTTLIGEIFKNSGQNPHVTGNIGVGILWELVNSSENDVFVIETSSFQLESTFAFKPKISIILNVTPDHINWHGTFDNYVNAKKKIFNNQDKEDYTILNYDDKILSKLEDEINSNLIYFSTDSSLKRGVYIDGEYIVVNDGKQIIEVLPYSEVGLPGKHILQDALAATCAAWIMGVDIEIIAKTLREFKGVEHRLKFVEEINGVSFYNDSKGTNPDSSINAVKAIKSPIILIAGGMDKGSDFTEFIESFNGKVKALVLLGETAEKIKKTAISHGFNNIYIVEDMKRAVKKSYELSSSGDNILLSPACASWDMYKNFEVRGEDFVNEVKGLRRA